MKVGFIGLGNQGAPMAQMIARAGLALHAWARREVSYEVLTDLPFVREGSAAELAAACDMVCLCLRTDAEIEAVTYAQGLLAAMRPDGVLAVHATVHPRTVAELGRRAADRGVHVLDAPVSGGAARALEADLTVMVGGPQEAFGRCLPVFQSYGDPVRHVGGLGAGQVCKLINNALYAAQWKMAHDADALATQLGLEREAFFDIIERSSGTSFSVGAYRNAGVGALPHAVKDTGLIEEVARSAGAPDSHLREAARGCAAEAERSRA